MTEDALEEIDAPTLARWMEAGEAVLLDVREASEYEFENVPGSVLLPLSFLDPDCFPPITDRKLVVLCAVGKRAAAAQKQLVAAGFERIYNLKDGIHAWKQAGFETQGGKFEAMDYTI